MGINAINLSHLNLAKLFRFFSRFILLIERIGVDKLKITEPVEKLLRPAFVKLDDSHKKDRASKWTVRIHELDKLIDNTISGMSGIVNAMLKSNDTAVAKAAKDLNFLFKQNKGITRKPREEQIADTKNLLQALKGEYASSVEKLGLEKWVTELEEFYEEIDSYTDSRTVEKGAKSKNDASVARKDIIEAYRTICKLIDVFVTMEGVANYEEFIRELNIIIGELGGSGTTSLPDVPAASGEDEEKYPDAKEWEEDLPFMGVENGDIYYILVAGKKVFYKLVDKSSFFDSPDSAKGASGWEKL